MTSRDVMTYDLHIMEISTQRRYAGEYAAYVQRVGDRICFYDGEVSDTDVARDPEVAEYSVTARTLGRIVEALKKGQDQDDGDYSYDVAGTDVTWRAPCGEERTVDIAVLDKVLAEFAE